jgi:hypothetical protein
MRNIWYLLICFLLTSVNLNAQAPVKAKTPTPAPPQGQPVIINRDTLLKLYVG